MMDLRRLLEAGLEYFGLYYGTYRAEVKDNNDPQKLGRVMVHCPQVHGPNYPRVWAWPISAMAMCQGGIWHVPDVGETVYVVFDHGRPEYPMWQGGWWGEGDTTEDMSIMKVVVCTPEGLKVVLDRSAQTIFLEQSPGNSVLLSDDKFTIAHNGTIEVTGDSVDIVSTGTTNLRGQGVVNVDALDEVNITSTGSIKVDAADTVEVSSTGELTVASAGTCVIQSDSPMEIKSAKSVNVTAPEIGLTGTLTVMGDTSITGKVSVVGDGNVRGKWLSTINNSAKHTHPIGPDPKDPLTKIALPGVL